MGRRSAVSHFALPFSFISPHSIARRFAHFDQGKARCTYLQLYGLDFQRPILSRWHKDRQRWHYRQDDQSVGRRCSLCQPFHFLPCCLSAPLTHLSASFSGTLELKATKDSAHNDLIRSVAFSPDGSKIVSGSRDKTIKVWDAGQPFHLLPCLLSSPLTSFLLASQILWNSRQPRERPQSLDQLRRLLSRRQDHRLRIV